MVLLLLSGLGWDIVGGGGLRLVVGVGLAGRLLLGRPTLTIAESTLRVVQVVHNQFTARVFPLLLLLLNEIVLQSLNWLALLMMLMFR